MSNAQKDKYAELAAQLAEARARAERAEQEAANAKIALSRTRHFKTSIVFTTEAQEKQSDVHTNVSNSQKLALLASQKFVEQFVVSDTERDNKRIVVLKNEFRDEMRDALDALVTKFA